MEKTYTSYYQFFVPRQSWLLLIIGIMFSLKALGQQQVVSYNLINADSDQRIQQLTNGATLNLATLPTRNLNIQAITNPVTVGSVKLILSGAQSRTQNENSAPYALFSETNGNYASWTPTVGSYKLTATPYTGSSGSGTVGTSLTISFSVINQAPTTNYSLTVSAVNGTVLKSPNQTSYASGTVVNLTASPNSGYRFSGWSGSATGTTNPLAVTMNSNKSITANFTSIQQSQIIQVNFQDPATVPPSGWVRDYGQPYGQRTGTYQGQNLIYGWKKRSDNSLLNIAIGGTTPGNGRNRKTPSNIQQATLMHMQADDIPGNFDGTKVEGYWEARVPNGIYDVTVSAGDAGVYPTPERHTLNVEGLQAIKEFVPTGISGASTRFKSAAVRVAVNDGNLTIDADGGFNTKINSARIVPVSTGPYTYWSVNEQQLAIEKGSSSTDKTFSLELSNSNNSNLQYNISATYGAGGSGWLSFNTTHTGTEPNVTFNYSAARNLPIGIYDATVNAAASGFASGSVRIRVEVSAPRPYVISSTPGQGASNISVNTASIAANNLFVPEVVGYQGGVDNSTITSSTVKLIKVVGTTTTQIQGVVQGTGGGDAISFSPTFALEANTTYRFMVTEGVKSHSGGSFIPYTATFTTGDAIEPNDPLSVEFTKVTIAGTQNKKYSSLTIGPDNKLYALRLDGVIERYNINTSDGTLNTMATISTLTAKYGARSAVGIVFDPAATATNLIAYVSHCSSGLANAPEFDGKISKLTGANLATEQLLVTDLPRSTKDHLVNSLAFGPDGALYISQGSNSSMGAYDASWQRNESLLSGAVLRLDLTMLGSSTLNARTTSNQSLINSASTSQIRFSDGTYNAYATNSPLKIYASGIRNAYDLVWHSNGQLYVPTNGSAAGGNTPASVTGTRRLDGTYYNGPAVSATTAVQVQNDWLFRINPQKGVGYFGHPNPLRGEFVANRGYLDNPKYPSNLGADPNYRGAAFNFELNRSPNGAIEYKSNAFNGALKGKLLVCRFSGGGDIIVLKPGSVVKGSSENLYDITESYTGAGTNGLVGMSGFINPLDIVEDVRTGNLYVIEFNWNNIPDRTSQITLLRVSSISDDEGFATAYPETISATEVVGVTSTNTAARYTAAKAEKNNKEENKDYSKVTQHAVTISNTGRGNLKLKSLAITGANASEFKMLGQPDANPNKPIKIRKNSSVTFNVAFYPTSKGEKTAKLEAISSKKNKDQSVSVELNGLGIEYEGSELNTRTQTTSAKKVTVDDKIIEVNKKTILKAYPNPITGSKIYLDLSGFTKHEPVTITMYDRVGQLYQAKTVVMDAQGTKSAELPLTEAIGKGMYIIKANGSSGLNQVTKIIIE